MKTKIFLIIAALTSFVFLPSASHCQEPFRQYLSWGITAAPTLSGWHHNLDTLTSSPDKIRPALGFDAGFFFNFHITPQWSLLFDGDVAFEHLKLSTDNVTDNMMTLGTDLEILLSWSTALASVGTRASRLRKNTFDIQLAAGPYTHFMILDLSTDPSRHPFSRSFSYDPRSDEPYFLLNDFSAGATLQASCQLRSGWQLFAKFRYSITDLLNVDSHRLYVRPYKLSVGVAYHFM